MVQLQADKDKNAKLYGATREELFVLKQQAAQLREQLRDSAPADEVRRAQRELTKANQDLQETRAALLSYKSMHNVVCEQVKSLKVMHERGKDEHESQLAALRDL